MAIVRRAKPSSRRIHDRGFIDVLGEAFHRAFHVSASGQRLDADLPAGRSILLIQISLDPELRGEYVELVDRCRRSGSDVATSNIVADVPWWFRPVQWEPEEKRASTRELLDATVEWLVGRFSSSVVET